MKRKKMDISEKIICAAIWYQDLETKVESMPKEVYLPKNIDRGVVVCGIRHSHCIYTRVFLTGLKDFECGKSIQGFLTNKNRFVDRHEGLEIALRENQVLDLNEVRGDRLFSEDLY